MVVLITVWCLRELRYLAMSLKMVPCFLYSSLVPAIAPDVLFQLTDSLLDLMFCFSSPMIQLKEIPYETIVRAKPPDAPKSDDKTDDAAPEPSGDRPEEKQSETEVQAALEILGYSHRGQFWGRGYTSVLLSGVCSSGFCWNLWNACICSLPYTYTLTFYTE